ncbi:hypothetical protein ACFUJY_04735 [Streptomyces sp. NPDC057249]|uniref:hypothetical protein n=1 Tax=Streptomyces sp. NPDC057249 TaxID=3346067 RepID=UPI0036330311
MATDRGPVVYEERYGWTRMTVGIGAGSVALAVLLLVLDVPAPVRWAGVVVFGGAALLTAFECLGRRPAFRVDADGVLLGGAPVRYRATTARVPWADVAAVVVWRQSFPGRAMPWVGAVVRPDAVPPAGPGRGALSRPELRDRVPGLPEGVVPVVMCRAVNGWTLDRPALVSAVGAFAPGLPVLLDE